MRVLQTAAAALLLASALRGVDAARNDTFMTLVAAQAQATLAQIPDPTLYPIQGAAQGSPVWATGSRTSWVAGFFSGTLLALYDDARRRGDGPAAAAG